MSQNYIPENFVSVRFDYESETEAVVGYVDDVVLTLHAEGRIKNFPVLTVDADRLVIIYYPIEGVDKLRVYPENLDQIIDVMPDDSTGMLENVNAATERLDENITIPAVPVTGDVNAD